MTRFLTTMICTVLLGINFLTAQITINFDSGSVNPGETIDIDVTVDDFDQIVLMQFSINWDSTVMVFDGVSNVTTTLPEFTEGGNIGTPSAPAVDEGQMTVSWSLVSTTPESLPDGHRLFTATFLAVGEQCDETSITVTDDPRAIEVVDENFNDIGLISNDGLVNIPGNCDGGEPEDCGEGDPNGVGIIGQELTAENGTNVCVSVSVENFADIQSAQSGILWDPTIITYTGVGNFGLPGLNEGLFNTTNTDDGELRFLWFDGTGENPVTLADGSVIFDVCFDVIGNNGEYSQVQFVDLPNFDIEFSDSQGNVLPYFTDCGIVEVGTDMGSDDFTLISCDIEHDCANGTTVCVDFKALNFVNLQSMQFNIMWDPEVLTYDTPANLDLPFLMESNFNLTDPGKLRVSWNTLGQGQDWPDNEVMFQVCYDVVDATGMTQIMFVDNPPINIEISDADNNVVPFELQEGFFTGVCDDMIIINLNNIVEPDCNGGEDGGINIVVSGGSGDLTCDWYEGTEVTGDPVESPPNCNLFGYPAGDYTVLVTDENGLTSSATFTITQPDPISISGNVTNETDGGDGAIDISVTGCQGDCSYAWDHGPNTEDVSGLSKGTYRVVVTDGNDCTAEMSFEVDPATLEISASQTSDAGCTASGTVSIEVSGGCPTYSYVWDGPGNFSSDKEDIDGLEAGEYCVTIMDSDTPPNTIEECFTVGSTIDPLAIDNAIVVNVDCNGESTGSIDIVLSGGCPPYSFVWDGPGNFSSDKEDIDGLEAGEYCVTVTDTADPENTAEACYTIEEPEAIVVELEEIVDSKGDDGSIDISASGGTGDLSFEWTPGGAETEDIEDLEPGDYTVEVTDENDCSVEVDFTVKWACVMFDPDDVGQYNGFGVSCFGECDGEISGLLQGNEPIDVFVNGELSSFPVTDLCEGTYMLEFVDAEGLTLETEIDIVGPELLTLVQDSTATECSDGDNGVLSVIASGGVGNYTYNWSVPGDGSTLTTLEPGDYTVIVSDDNNCQVMLQNLVVESCINEPCYESRTTITPNGDNLNEELFINCADLNPNQIGIFDRWGRQVYSQTNYDNAWNGTDFGGNELPEGAYMWVLEVTLPTGEVQIQKGWVTILREEF